MKGWRRFIASSLFQILTTMTKNSDSPTFRLLFICLGNICRSAAADNLCYKRNGNKRN